MSFRHAALRLSRAIGVMFVLSCSNTTKSDFAADRFELGTGPTEVLQLPKPFETPSVRNTSKVIGWPAGKMPTAAPGLQVSLFADRLNNPRSS